MADVPPVVGRMGWQVALLGEGLLTQDFSEMHVANWLDGVLADGNGKAPHH